ncbi:MAG: RNA-binding protein [Sarcina sp.]
MNKEQFNNILKSKTDFDILKLYDIYERALSRGISLFTEDFYPPAIWKPLEKLSSKNFSVESNGIFEDCDRRVIAFNKSEWSDYPIKLLEIKCNTKFSKLEHKDYLGSIMALGIKREKIGDVILKGDDVCYLATYEKIALFIIDNLHKVKKLSCECRILDDFSEEIPQIEFKENMINVASTRLDALVSELANISRNKACDLISKGLVLVDYVQVTDKSYEVEEDMRITIRKIGKFKVKETLGTTKSGRLKITVLKYT